MADNKSLIKLFITFTIYVNKTNESSISITSIIETVFKILKNTFDMEYEKEKRNSSVNEKYMEWKTIFYSLTIGERKDQLF